MRLLGIPQAVLRAALLLPLIPTVPAAQDRRLDHNFHGWYTYFGDHPVANTKWEFTLKDSFAGITGSRNGSGFCSALVHYQATP